MIRRRTPKLVQEFYRAAQALYDHSSDWKYTVSLLT